MAKITLIMTKTSSFKKSLRDQVSPNKSLRQLQRDRALLRLILELAVLIILFL